MIHYGSSVSPHTEMERFPLPTNVRVAYSICNRGFKTNKPHRHRYGAVIFPEVLGECGCFSGDFSE